MFEYIDKDIGRVRVVAHPTSRRITCRWKDGYVKVVVPVGVGQSRVRKSVDKLKPQILAMKPSVTVREEIVMDDWKIKIGRQNIKPDHFVLTATLPDCRVDIGQNIDVTTPEGSAGLQKALHRLAYLVAPKLLLPYAMQVTAEDTTGKPEKWKISRGHQVLGHCDSKGVIALSYILVFLPRRLRRYVIYHEVAHLFHMDHSVKFHEMLDSFLGGQERSLAREIKHYKWPVER